MKLIEQDVQFMQAVQRLKGNSDFTTVTERLMEQQMTMMTELVNVGPDNFQTLQGMLRYATLLINALRK